ncbi:MAG: FtsX-like permease family protein [Chryseolinea sp.]
MEIVTGRNFSSTLTTDSSSIILNESASKQLYPEAQPLGKHIAVGDQTFTVIGVVKDFNFNSLRENVTPLVMVLGNDWRSNLIVRTSGGQLANTLSQIRKMSKKLNPGHELEFSVMEHDFESMYSGERRTQKLFIVFTILSLVVAGVGLFGVLGYCTEQRTRELAIRKILGASNGAIVKLLTVDFIKLIFIATGIALPLAWWIMERWLNAFANRINIPISTVFLSGGLILLIAMLIISYQTLKTSMSNPVDCLRSE